MRTTLTLDDDVAEKLRQLAQRGGHSFKAVVNEALRRGLSAGAKPAREGPAFKVRAHTSGFRAGVDIGKLNQLVDDLDLERFGDRLVHDSADDDRS